MKETGIGFPVFYFPSSSNHSFLYFLIKSAANINFSAFTADLIYLDIMEKINSAVKGSFHDFTAGLIIYSTSFPLILPNQQIRQIYRQINRQIQ